MKKYFYAGCMILASVFFLMSCENSKEPGKGTLDFKYTGSALKCVPLPDSTVTSEPGVIDPMPPVYTGAYSVLVTITDLSGKAVLDKTEIPIYELGGQYISKQISLTEGKYQLTEFLVVNSMRQVIYAAPKAGSKMAANVKQPLPISISVTAETTTHIVPEVVPVTGITATDLGYATFGFVVVDPAVPGERVCLNLKIVNGLEAKMTDKAIPAHISIYGINKLILEMNTDSSGMISFPACPEYTFVVTAAGFNPYKRLFKLEELKPFMCQMNQQLIIALGTDTTAGTPSQTPVFYFDQPFKIMTGQIVPCATEIMKIQFVSFSDSRCPVNAMCAWAGEASVVLSVFTNTSGYPNITVKLGATAFAGPYMIKMSNLLPLPSDVTIPEKTAVLTISKAEVIPL